MIVGRCCCCNRMLAVAVGLNTCLVAVVGVGDDAGCCHCQHGCVGDGNG